MSLTKIIRDAILNNTVRAFQFDEIAEKAGCSRNMAKQLHYSFLWRAPENYLQALLKSGT